MKHYKLISGVFLLLVSAGLLYYRFDIIERLINLQPAAYEELILPLVILLFAVFMLLKKKKKKEEK